MDVRKIFSCSMGNIVEWYDFALFIYCGPIFAKVIFPESNHLVNYLYLFAIFAVGFICRPIGGILLGHIGDKAGRSRALILSMIFISIPTFLMSFLPTYAQIGIFSPILLILIRLIQGICIGGEYCGTMIYLAEVAPSKKKAFFTSLSATGANAGFFLGIGITSILEHLITKNQMLNFGWRLEFFLGGVFSIFIIYFRYFLSETPVFVKLKNEGEIVKNPLKESIKNDYLLIIKIIGIVSFGTTLYYITFTYLSSYLVQYHHFNLKQITNIETFFIGSMFILVPIFSLACDRFGKKIMYMIFCGFGVTTAFFIFYFFQFGSKDMVLLCLAFLTILSSMEQATTLITVVELLPVAVRYTSLSIGYNLGNVIFGGLTPFSIAELTKVIGSGYIPAFYLAFTGLLTIFTVYFSKIQ